jgi:CBS domain containing-hemolysin-like protein
LSSSEIALRLAVVLILIAINGFFVTAEFAVVSVRRSRINQLVVDGDLQSRSVQRLQNQIDQLLSTTQLGITLSSLALGWLGERTVLQFISPLFSRWLGSPSSPTANLLAIICTFVLLAYLQIVLGELIPKSLALTYAEGIARVLAPPSLVIAKIFQPLIWVLNQSTNLILRTVGIADNRHNRHQLSSQELQLLIATERESIGLQSNQRQIIDKVFALNTVTLAEVMVPKPQMDTVPMDATWQMVLDRVAITNFSRYPVTGRSSDEIIGTIHYRDLAKPMAAGRLNLDSPIKSCIRPLHLFFESASIDEVLLPMQAAGIAMAMVVNEYGGMVGLLTRKDAIAEILGKQKEDYPRTEPIVAAGKDTFLVQAQISVNDLNEALKIMLPVTEEYQTLGGFLLYRWQQMPILGEPYRYQNLEFTVSSMDGNRLDRVLIHRHPMVLINHPEPS